MPIRRRRRRGIFTRRATAGSKFFPGEERQLLDYTHPKNRGWNPPKKQPDSSEELQRMGVRDFPSELWIEPREWKDWSDWLDDQELSAEHGRLKCGRWSNQSPTHECTTHSLMQGAEAARRAQCGFNPDYEVWLSMISVYSIANPGKWGGAGCLQVLRIMIEQGALPEPVNGQDKKFLMTLHGTCGKGVSGKNASGPWVTERKNPEFYTSENAKKTRRHFKPTPETIINPKSREEMACLILRQRVINVGRRGHAVPKNRLIWVNRNDEMPAFGYPDSYEVYRLDSWNAAAQEVGGSSCIHTMPAPDNWADPSDGDVRKELMK